MFTLYKTELDWEGPLTKPLVASPRVLFVALPAALHATRENCLLIKHSKLAGVFLPSGSDLISKDKLAQAI